jgi:hypothetical protein
MYCRNNMKPFSIIIISILIALCAGSCILLIVVIMHTAGNDKENKSTETGIQLPERFREMSAVQQGDSNTAQATPPSPLPAPKYTCKYICTNMIHTDELKLIIAENNLFCKKSPWSKLWANPKGSGIRSGQEGLHLRDSVVADTLTNIMWQRYSTSPPLPYGKIDSAIALLNTARWQGFDNWRSPTIEEIMALLVPEKNRSGLFLPGKWNCNVQDIWSCNSACDSVSVRWIWVARLAMGRCNLGHPDIIRALLAVRSM